MIGKYKIIALLTCRVQDKDCHEFICELNNKLTKINCRLFVYNCNYQIGAKNVNSAQTTVYDLIDPSFVDAAIIQMPNINNRSYSEMLAGKMKNLGIPTIILGDRFDGYLNIYYNHKAGFRSIISHLINEHGITDFHMIAGPKGNPFSNDRIDAFKETLAEYGITYDDSMLSYGDFWSGPAIETAGRLLKENKLPGAFICANDMMAIAIASFLKSQGVSIPEDVVVTGYDCIETIYSSEPTITSGYINPQTSINTICDVITDVFENGTEAIELSIEPEIVFNESCGCSSSKKINSAALFNEQNNLFYRFQDENIILSETSSEIQQCRSFEEIAFSLYKNNLLYAMCCLIKPECIDESISPESVYKKGFGKELYLLYDSDMIDRKERRGERFSPYFMPSEDIIPSMDYYMDDERCLIFSVIYYLNVPMGYACFHFSDYVSGNFYKIPQTISMLNNTLGGFRNLRHAHYLLKQINDMSKTDVLTGLYNRRGFQIEYQKLLDNLGNKSVCVMMCDLDKLKHINDNFGHEEGDTAIQTVAEALKKFCPPETICTRLGGDEMMAVYPSTGDNDNIYSQITNYLDNYNENSGKKYKVSASIGIFKAPAGVKLDFEELIKESDKLMYEDKKHKRQWL